MKMTVEMPPVSSCGVTECAYNVDQGCHARAITIGDGVFPGCDTILSTSPHTRDRERIAGVGACKVSPCTYNEDYECMADSIAVGYGEKGVCCLTFAAR